MPVVRLCSSGSRFDVDLQRCLPLPMVPACANAVGGFRKKIAKKPDDSILLNCASVNPGLHAARHRSCTRLFVSCAAFAAQMFQCPDKQRFNEATKSCASVKSINACIKNKANIPGLKTFKNRPVFSRNQHIKNEHLDKSTVIPAATSTTRVALRRKIWKAGGISRVTPPEATTRSSLAKTTSRKQDYECSQHSFFERNLRLLCSAVHYACIQGRQVTRMCPPGTAFHVGQCSPAARVPGCSALLSSVRRAEPVKSISGGAETPEKFRLKPILVEPPIARQAQLARSLSLPKFTCKSHPDGNYDNPRSNCSAWFFSCAAGIQSRQHCPSGTRYDSSIDRCQYPKYIRGCGGNPEEFIKSMGAEAILKIQKKSKSHAARDLPYFRCGTETGNFANAASRYCSQFFFTCTGSPRGVVMKCPGNTFYDEDSDRCLFGHQIKSCLDRGANLEKRGTNGIDENAGDELMVLNEGGANLTKVEVVEMKVPDEKAHPAPINFQCSQVGNFPQPGLACSQQFVVCLVNGQPINVHCAEDTYYDPEMDRCIPPESVDGCKSKAMGKSSEEFTSGSGLTSVEESGFEYEEEF